MTSARDLIESLRLEPHPEGGWYRETWRGPPGEDGRAVGTAIHFLLEARQQSHWHRVDAAEIWLWHAGDPLDLLTSATDDGPAESLMLGSEIAAGQRVQHIVAPGAWQAARPCAGNAGYVLVSCVVTPGFRFEGFTLAPPGWAPGHGDPAQ